MTPPRDPFAPPEGFPENRQGTGSFYTRDLTPIESMAYPSPSPERKGPSTGFIATIAGILGVFLTGSVLLGGLGKAFFVTREEHANQLTSYSNDKSEIRQSLLKLEGTLNTQNNALEKQGAAIERMLDKIQAIKEDMARRSR
jgi:hypothetical protein